MKPPRILIIDIERLPGLVPIFDQRTQGFIPVYKWTRLPTLLCFAAKWHGTRRTMFHAVWDNPDIMVQAAWDLYNEADIVVTYNGRRFDNKHLRSEWVVAGLTPPSPWKDVDLFAVNKAAFGFESKSLQHLCERLGLPGKSGHYDAGMAEQCVSGDVKAQRTMRRYNVGDVTITGLAYDRLKVWAPNHPNMNLYVNDTDACPTCASRNVIRRGKANTNTRAYPRFSCNDCGRWFQGTHSIESSTVKNAA